MAEPVVPTEPVAVAEPKNDSVPTPPAPANDEAEKLRKELDQARMRANQLENEKRDRDKATEEAQRKSLEEQNEFKELYEKSNAELKRIHDEQEATTRQTELQTATQDVLKDFPTEVIEIAKTAGLSLTDDSEASKAALTEKLNSIKERVAPNSNPTVEPSNPYNPGEASTNGEPGKLQRPHNIGIDDGNTAVSFSPDPRKVNEYIRSLPVMDTIKRSSGYYK